MRQPVRRPLLIDDVAQIPSFLNDMPFISLEVTCQRIRRVGNQTHINQRSLKIKDGVVETKRIDGVADAEACDRLQRYAMYETLGTIFSELLPALHPRRR